MPSAKGKHLEWEEEGEEDDHESTNTKQSTAISQEFKINYKTIINY